jgi:short-subunit dehydrogenase
MTGKTVVITGPTSGIGKEIARGLAKLGANLVLGCRDTVAGTALAAELGRGNDGSVIEVVPVDLARGHRSRSLRREFSKRILGSTCSSTTPG